MNKEIKYKVVDRQGGIFGEYYNDKGGITLAQLQERASEWLHLDNDEEDFEEDPVRNNWSVEDIADFWELDITPMTLEDKLKPVQEQLESLVKWHNKNLTKEQMEEIEDALDKLQQIIEEEKDNEV